MAAANGCGVGDIEDTHARLSAAGRDGVRRLLQRPGISSVQHDPGPCRRQTLGDLQAQTARRARDQGQPAGEVEGRGGGHGALVGPAQSGRKALEHASRTAFTAVV